MVVDDMFTGCVVMFNEMAVVADVVLDFSVIIIVCKVVDIIVRPTVAIFNAVAAVGVIDIMLNGVVNMYSVEVANVKDVNVISPLDDMDEIVDIEDVCVAFIEILLMIDVIVSASTDGMLDVYFMV